MADLPDPLTPPDCDLRDFAWMPLDVVRLRDSDLAGLRDPEAFRCAMLLFCAAWHQVPAASLPDNDETLGRLAGYGRDAESFLLAKKAGALRGWVKCKDGRLYHPVMAEKAREAHDQKQAQKRRTEAARLAKEAKRTGTTGEVTAPRSGNPTEPVTQTDRESVTEAATVSVTERVTGSNRQDRTGQEIQREDSVLRTAPSGAAVEDARISLWREGETIIRNLTGKPPDKSRAFLGKMLATLGDDCAAALAICREANVTRPLSPVDWIVAAAKARAKGATSRAKGRGGTASDLLAERWDLEGFADLDKPIPMET